MRVTGAQFCPAMCDRSDYSAPKCLDATTKCVNDPGCQTFPDCQTVEEWGACSYGQYCNRRATGPPHFVKRHVRRMWRESTGATDIEHWE